MLSLEFITRVTAQFGACAGLYHHTLGRLCKCVASWGGCDSEITNSRCRSCLGKLLGQCVWWAPHIATRIAVLAQIAMMGRVCVVVTNHHNTGVQHLRTAMLPGGTSRAPPSGPPRAISGHPSQKVSRARVSGLLTHNASGGRSRARSWARRPVAWGIHHSRWLMFIGVLGLMYDALPVRAPVPTAGHQIFGGH